MARRFITPMGRHKPVRSSWQAMDSKAFTRSYEPETRPEFRCYVGGQADAAKRDYQARLKRDAQREQLAKRIAELQELGLA